MRVKTSKRRLDSFIAIQNQLGFSRGIKKSQLHFLTAVMWMARNGSCLIARRRYKKVKAVRVCVVSSELPKGVGGGGEKGGVVLALQMFSQGSRCLARRSYLMKLSKLS